MPWLRDPPTDEFGTSRAVSHQVANVPEVAYLQPRAGLTANGLGRIISKQGDRMMRVNFRTNT
jgi:hypothetical protein